MDSGYFGLVSPLKYPLHQVNDMFPQINAGIGQAAWELDCSLQGAPYQTMAPRLFRRPQRCRSMVRQTNRCARFWCGIAWNKYLFQNPANTSRPPSPENMEGQSQ